MADNAAKAGLPSIPGMPNLPAQISVAAYTGDWRDLYRASTGLDPGSEFVPPYVASLTFFLITAFSGILLRAMTRLIVPWPLKNLVLVFLATMEACAYFFENNFVMKHYGPLWLFIAVVAQCFLLARTLGGASENPIQVLPEVLAGRMNIVYAIIQLLVQAGAGLASYRFAQLLWSLDMIADHHERFYETECAADLEVPVLTGLLIEAGATLSDTWLQRQTVLPVGLLDEFLKAANVGGMIVLGVSTTGMYFNPAMASGHTLGCGDVEFGDHLIVYWAGPFIGCLVALLLDKVIHIDMSSQAKAKQD